MPRRKRKYEEYITIGIRNDGHRIRKYIGADSKSEFERLKYEARKKAELVRNPSNITFYAYASEWIPTYKGMLEPSTQHEYYYALNQCKPIHDKPLADVTTSDLQKIINTHIDHPHGCKKIKHLMQQVYAQAITDGILPPFNLGANVVLPKLKKAEKRTITDAEMEAIDRARLDDQDRLYLEVLKGTGMRPAEALALQWGDINGLNITVNRSLGFNKDRTSKIKTTKTGAVRTIPISQDLADMLSDAPKRGIFVFTVNGRQFNKMDYDIAYKRIMAAINRAMGGTKNLSVLNGLNFYSFRHTYATQLYYKAVLPGCISTKKAAQIMGHSEQLFISTYTHIDNRFEDENAIRNMFKKGDQRETIGV